MCIRDRACSLGVIWTRLNRFGLFGTDKGWFGQFWIDLNRFWSGSSWFRPKCSKLWKSDRSRRELSNGGMKTFVRWNLTLVMTFRNVVKISRAGFDRNAQNYEHQTDLDESFRTVVSRPSCDEIWPQLWRVGMLSKSVRQSTLYFDNEPFENAQLSKLLIS